MNGFIARLLALLLLAAAAVEHSAPASAMDVNAFRKANGAKPMRQHTALAALAKAHAQDMARRQSMDHAGFFERRARNGAAGENVSYGCASMTCAMQQWINSAPHRANLLRPDFTRYGLASASSVSGQRFWAMVFGR